MKKLLILVVILLMLFTNISNASEELSQEEIMKSQQESLHIDDFIEEADKYAQDVYSDIDISDLFSSAITGTIDNETIFRSIFNILGDEVLDAISVLGSILVIIVIHSILKSLSDGLENKGVAQITYYVQYILIVTLIMTNFVQILDIVKDSIQSLVGFMNSLIPILITLMVSTRKYCLCKLNTTNYTISYHFYRKLHNRCNYSISTYINITWNNFENIRQSTG